MGISLLLLMQWIDRPKFISTARFKLEMANNTQVICPHPIPLPQGEGACFLVRLGLLNVGTIKYSAEQDRGVLFAR